MSDKPRGEKGGGAAVLAVGLGLLVALLMLYVLSIGPAARLASKSRIEQDTFFAIYQPIFLAARDTGADDAITEYIDLWGGGGVFFTADLDIPFPADSWRELLGHHRAPPQLTACPKPAIINGFQP